MKGFTLLAPGSNPCVPLTFDSVDPLRSVPATAVVTVCPDCPTSDNLNEPVVKETVALALQRFNEESRLVNYFTLESITRASSQVKRKKNNILRHQLTNDEDSEWRNMSTIELITSSAEEKGQRDI